MRMIDINWQWGYNLIIILKKEENSMKKALAILLALLLLTMAACGQESTQTEQQEQANAETQLQNEPTQEAAEEIDETTVPANYVDKYEKNGITFMDHYENGVLVRSDYRMPDGSSGSEHMDADGNLTYTMYKMPDGSSFETHYYPDGNISKDITRNADGSYCEFHYANDGTVDTKTMTFYPGTLIYQKEVAADGTVLYEYAPEFREDGTYVDTFVADDGTVYETTYGAGGKIVASRAYNETTGWTQNTEYYESGLPRKSVTDDPSTGDHTETEYYDIQLTATVKETGYEYTYTVTKSSLYQNSQTGAYQLQEYHENDMEKYTHVIMSADYEWERKCDEEGNILYERNFNYGRETEFFGEGGVLVKYVDNGTVYEGDQIPANAKQNFEEIQKNIKETYAERH